METIPLCDLQPGQCGIVCRLNTGEHLRRRLLDMGLTPGSPVTCLGRSPGGDPAAYLICRAVVAIRREDTSAVTVRLCVSEHKEGDLHGAD